jgi:hypothetical protein
MNKGPRGRLRRGSETGMRVRSVTEDSQFMGEVLRAQFTRTVVIHVHIDEVTERPRQL